MRKGFTIVELLIVIVVIGILVGIGIASYNGFQKRAHDASVQSDLESIAGQLEAFRTRPSTANRFPTSTAELDPLEIQAAKGSYDTTVSYNMVYCVGPSAGTEPYQTFKLIALTKNGTVYVMTQDGLVSNSLTAASMTAGLCTAQGMPLQLTGMAAGATWASWVHSS